MAEDRWKEVESVLPKYVRDILSPSRLSTQDGEGKRFIFSDNPFARWLNLRLGIMLDILRLVNEIIDHDVRTTDIEIVTPEFEEALERFQKVFPGTIFLGYINTPYREV